MGEVCCKACGSVHVREKHGRWGPHRVRITCEDCGRFVKWGAIHKQVKRLDPHKDDTVATMVRRIDDELGEAGDRLGLHWGFFLEPAHGHPNPTYDAPWPEEVCCLFRGGGNEGWIIEL